MRLLQVIYEVHYSNSRPDEWFRDEQFIVAGEDSATALNEFRDKVLSHQITPDAPDLEPVTIEGFRLVAANLKIPKINFVASDVVLNQALEHGLIEPLPPDIIPPDDEHDDEHADDFAAGEEMDSAPLPPNAT